MIDFSTLKKTGKPNSYLVLPPSFACPETADMISPMFDEPATEVFGRLSEIIGHTPGWSMRESDLATKTLSFVATTPLLRFKDDVDIQIVEGETAEKSYIAIYSRSRIGYSDLGANKKRVESLLRFL